jgi:hypothetical protein
MSEWFQLASSPSVVRRALAYAVIVGTILISINHGDALLRGEWGTVRFLKMGLTVLVPYTVSTLSSVQAMRQFKRSTPTSPTEPTPLTPITLKKK